MRWLLLTLAAIPAFAAWAWLVFIGTSRGWWHEPLAPAGDAHGFVQAAAASLASTDAGALRLLEAGEVAAEHYQARGGHPVDADSRFLAGSLGMWLTAWGVLRQVDAGDLDLDAPVATYLTRWQLPDSPFDNEQVSVRRLLTHTAGLTDQLGYAGFPPDTSLPSLEATLTDAADAVPGADGRVRVGIQPGREWRYSGGGYALLQLLVEETSGLSFENYMRARVLDPLGLERSTFAPVAGPDGTPPRRRFAAPAAAGLTTTTADLTRLIRAHLAGNGAPGGDVLRPTTLAAMIEPAAPALGSETWGLGVTLYADNGSGGHILGHDGTGPAISSAVRFDPASGDGISVLVDGSRGVAGRLAGEWVFWKTGQLDVHSFYGASSQMMRIIAVGWVAIAAIVVVLGWIANRRPSAAG